MARGLVHAFRRYEVVTVSPDLIESAIEISILHPLSFWDSLIIAAAETTSCGVLFSEDLSHGQVVRGVRIENPFRAGARG